MRQENTRIRDPAMKKALEDLLVPSLVLKMGPGTETGQPDVIYWIPGGSPLMHEYKWEAWQPEPKQMYWHQIFRELGYEVQVHNSVAEALYSIAVEVVAAALYASRREISIRAWRGNPYARSWLKENLHYTRSILFLEEATGRKKDARDSAVKSVLQSLARRDSKVEGL